MQQLNPQLYEEECRRVQSRFDEAVRLAEEAFCAELAKLVGHLTERLSGQEDGKPKIFRDSAIENLTQFFQRFRALNVRSSEQLDRLVTVTAALAAFLSDPQAFISGARDLTAIVAENVARPVAEVPGAVAVEVARGTNWTVIVLVALGMLAVLVMSLRIADRHRAGR